jgi:hypothetical protein
MIAMTNTKGNEPGLPGIPPEEQKQSDAELIKRLLEFKKLSGASDVALGRMLGSNST